ncbi:hypothetical protein BDR03DRAFT_970896, partial [Suillus americanus]
ISTVTFPWSSIRPSSKDFMQGDISDNLQRYYECWKHARKSLWQSSQGHGIASHYNCQTIGLG